MQGLPVDFGAADYKYFRLTFAQGQGCFYRIYHFTAFNSDLLPRNDNVSAPGQGFSNRFVGFTAHDNGMTGSDLFKMLKVIRQVPKQLIVLAYNVIFRGGYYGGDYH